MSEVQREKAKAANHLFSDSNIKKKLAVILNPIGGVGRAVGVKFKGRGELCLIYGMLALRQKAKGSLSSKLYGEGKSAFGFRKYCGGF